MGSKYASVFPRYCVITKIYRTWKEKKRLSKKIQHFDVSLENNYLNIFATTLQATVALIPSRKNNAPEAEIQYV